jgi:hypothetical protein
LPFAFLIEIISLKLKSLISMSERGSFRGGRGQRGGRGGQGQQKSGGGGGAQEKPKKENILDLNKYMDKEVQVKFNGGREGMFWLPFLVILSYFFELSCSPPSLSC